MSSGNGIQLHAPGYGPDASVRALARESVSMAHLAKRMRRRLNWWLKKSELKGTGGGGPIPDEDWRLTMREYSTAVLGLLREQRERARMAHASFAKGQAAVLTDQDYEAELASLAKEAIRMMPKSELKALLKERVDIEVKP